MPSKPGTDYTEGSPTHPTISASTAAWIAADSQAFTTPTDGWLEINILPPSPGGGTFLQIRGARVTYTQTKVLPVI